MNKKKKLIIIFAALLAICVVIICLFFNKTENAKIIVATDTHYLSNAINDKGDAFMEMVNNSDGKLVQYCDEIVDAFSSEVIDEQPDALIISGDLTFNGEKASHIDFAKKLKTIQDSGVPVLVIAGNHDINIKNSAEYKGDEYLPTESVNVLEFRDIYYDFGLKDAVSTDDYSLSYLYKINDDLYALMLDTNALGKNFVQDNSYDWIREQLEFVKKKHAKVITVSHQNLFAHNEQLSFGYQLYDAKELLALLNEYEVKLHLSGHIHMQHIMQDGVCEVVTSSLLVSPVQYGVIDYNGKFDYHTESVDVEKWTDDNDIDLPELQNFSIFADRFFKQSGINKSLAQLDNDNLTDIEKRLIAETFATLNASYFAGTKIDASELQEGIDLIKSQDGFLSNYINILVNESSNDYQSIKIR